VNPLVPYCQNELPFDNLQKAEKVRKELFGGLTV
jgi:hypothetical protein